MLESVVMFAMIIAIVLIAVAGIFLIAESYEDYAFNKKDSIFSAILGLFFLGCAIMIIVGGAMDIITIHDNPCFHKQVM